MSALNEKIDLKTAGIVVTAAALVLGGVGWFNLKDGAPNAPDRPAGEWVTHRAALACMTEQALQDAGSYVLHSERAQIETLAASGTCTTLLAGAHLVLVEYGQQLGAVRVRQHGSSTASGFWIDEGAIRD